ncbi:PREDICTED: baculoviral IAP repeat-containing protein 7-B-like [Vollenhovia emeryi]|uniref:baculoviral IAP repeat-containing protein 7-B-like n=1 Tax=Vollenhovia emeryi TaxID=411798 RepID=UPI0005F482FC|nr:PREDICTED: baculoviral IAP repeat-containing protein 7-B-like [Vollenhovia emeryi]XP_011876983.1 PREDICTED: baculoviral IAP repeat-containing protein 7-B-like [Vollenhovia emeryi]
MTGVIEHYPTLPPNRLSSSSPLNPIFIEESDEIDNGDDYRFEVARLATFKNWPCSWVKPEALAAAGFYYTGESDKVTCFECNIEICEWQADDNPMVDHQRWSGRCRFIRNIPCGNVPIGADPSTIPEPAPKGMDVCGPYGRAIYMPYSGPDHEGTEEEKVNYKSIGIASRPKHPAYASYATRLASFDRWPIAMSQTKESLATAGFFYTGSGDQTLCYHCGGGLRDWEPQDDPWIEHAKWFEYCPYLVLTKGTEFVSNITGRKYIATENSVTQLDEKVGKDTESIASGSSQNSTTSEEANTTEESAESGEARSEEQSIEGEKPYYKDARLCKICYNREVRIVFMPCGHLLACAECAKNMRICGVCRKPVERTVQVYLP